jgi:hypothetical protein
MRVFFFPFGKDPAPALAMTMCVGVTMLASAVAPERSDKFFRLKGSDVGEAQKRGVLAVALNPDRICETRVHLPLPFKDAFLLGELVKHLLIEFEKGLVERILQAADGLVGGMEYGVRKARAQNRGGGKFLLTTYGFLVLQGFMAQDSGRKMLPTGESDWERAV